MDKDIVAAILTLAQIECWRLKNPYTDTIGKPSETTKDIYEKWKEYLNS